MTLRDTGDRVDTLEGTNARAVDDSGKMVVVSASYEAIQDHGWEKIFHVASEKYANGDIKVGSNPPLVQVTTSDF